MCAYNKFKAAAVVSHVDQNSQHNVYPHHSPC